MRHTQLKLILLNHKIITSVLKYMSTTIDVEYIVKKNVTFAIDDNIRSIKIGIIKFLRKL